MITIVLCIIAFLSSLLFARRSLALGLFIVLGWGYFFGILRANLFSSASYFTFDSALLGLYCAQLANSFHPRDASRTRLMRGWLIILMLWPLAVCFLPFQPFLVSIVGFRAAVFFLPVALLGARMQSKDLSFLARGMALLNLAALGFATAEYFLGIERFYPLSPVTMLIYASNDVANFTAYRLPATFVTAHAYAGTVVLTLPFLYGAWGLEQRRRYRLLLLSGMAAAILGMLMAATRVNFVLTVALLTVATFEQIQKGAGRRTLWIWVPMVAALAYSAFHNERFDRFKTLADTDMVSERIAGSVNRTFWEILLEHPMGNGMGGGGTSIPSFLAGQVRNPIGLENEYSRILLEEGVIGLAIWICFFAWFLSRRKVAFAKYPWAAGRRLAWVACVGSFGIGMIGLGTWTAIPSSMLLALSIGWCAVQPADGARIKQAVHGIRQVRTAHPVGAR